ncbi:MAG: hypothetical protein ISP67_02975 [Flavobacteriaceae bacterium]|nr:hypothetical protein [Flavobacteriaceae bacterium]
MKRTILTITISGLVLTSNAQDFKIRKLEESNPNFPEEIYIFPILEGSDNNVAQKINSYLIEDQLENEYGKEKESIFENIWQTKNSPTARINSLSYKVELINKKLYTVTISGEFCSAYCEWYDMSYTFDLLSGDLLTLNTLFSIEGQDSLLQELIEYKRELIEQKIIKINEIIQSDTLDTDERNYYQEMLDLYQDCDSEYDELKNFRFVPSQNSIKIIYGRCSTHYYRNIDELWYFEKEIIIDNWIYQLSEIGKEKLIN